MSDLNGSKSTLWEVSAGPHERHNAVISVPGGHCAGGGSHLLEETDLQGRVLGQLPAQCQAPVRDYAAGTMMFILPHLAAEEKRCYRLVGDPASPEPGATLQALPGQCDFQIRGEPLTSYVFGPEVARPYCYPVLGPGGAAMTNFAPTDHPHHKSMYIAHGEVNGHDNWGEAEGHAHSVNESCTVLGEGPVYAELAATNRWETADGQPLLRETTTLRAYNLPRTARLLQWKVVLAADFGGVFFGDTKEAGVFAVRVAQSMEGVNGGRIVNALGGVGESECWGKPAPWVDYSGCVGEATVGIALFDHPGNFRHPTPWHVREYGLFAANCWGLHDFAGDWSVRGDYALPPGQSMTFTYGICLHPGDEVQGKVADQWLNFAYPPHVRVVK